MKADLEAIVKRSRGIAERMNAGVGYLMKKNKVDIIWGEATLSKPGEVTVSDVKKKGRRAAGADAERRQGSWHLHGQTHHRCNRRTARALFPALNPMAS